MMVRSENPDRWRDADDPDYSPPPTEIPPPVQPTALPYRPGTFNVHGLTTEQLYYVAYAFAWGYEDATTELPQHTHANMAAFAHRWANEPDETRANVREAYRLWRRTR